VVPRHAVNARAEGRLAPDFFHSPLKFEEQQLTSFAGLVVFQKLFETCRLKERLQGACAHLAARHHYGFSTILQCLIVHLLLGYRQLRESAFYRDDPLVKRVLGLKVLPSVPTVSRMLSEFDAPSVAAQQVVSRDLVLERLEKAAFRTDDRPPIWRTR
jgi:hypothetical protein